MPTELLRHPYVVLWPWDSGTWYDQLAAWLKKNLKGKVNIISIAQSTRLIWLEENGDFEWKDFDRTNPYNLLMLFELADDAMLFKLSWSNNGQSC